VLAAGWASNSKYSLLGAIRGVAQTISYEVRIVLILLSPLILRITLNIVDLISLCHVPFFFLLSLRAMRWFVRILAETNRSPFDFAEGESELVSGFNTEYSGGLFAFLFMAEYINILFMRLITVLVFFPIKNVYGFTGLIIFFSFCFI